MDDEKIVQLYWDRDERALEESKIKYGRYCYKIAYAILNDAEDSEESVNDTYFSAWQSMPPHRPTVLSTFLGKLTRNISAKRLRSRNAEKRGGGEYTLALDELAECVPSESDVTDEIFLKELSSHIDVFLRELPKTDRQIFLCRYFYLDTIQEISDRFGYGESKVKMLLMRTRKKLLERLLKEGML